MTLVFDVLAAECAEICRDSEGWVAMGMLSAAEGRICEEKLETYVVGVTAILGNVKRHKTISRKVHNPIREDSASLKPLEILVSMLFA